jgi:hypothetical protein
VIALIAAAALAQEGTRQLWVDFSAKRPASTGAPATTRPKPIVYKPVPGSPSVTSASPGSAVRMLGITLWRLREPKPAEPLQGARLLVLERPGTQTREQVPERVESGTLLSPGDLVRLTVEVPSSGYLYVIDREEYADGTSSDPYLIYPNWQTKPGDNAVAPGRLLEIPDQRDAPNVFTLRPQRPNQTAEVLAMLISPEVIPNLKIGDQPTPLGLKMYEDWQKRWGVAAERLELAGGAGTTWTGTEKDAGSNHNHLLTRDDAPPQTVYRVAAKPGAPILVQVPLRIKK